MKINNIIIGLSALAFVACTNAKSEEKTYAKIDSKQELVKVKTIKSKLDKFKLELVCNGKAVASKKASLAFIISDIVKSVKVRNGDRVKKGQLLASLDTYKSEQLLRTADLSLRKSKLELENELISNGYKFKDTAKVEKKIFDIMKLRSGYTAATDAYSKAIHDYKHTNIYAPFSGLIADMDVKECNPSAEYKKFCLLLDDSNMEIVFDVLETEISYLKKGMKVEASSFADQSIHLFGKIIEINPKIDENGMVKLKALIDNKGSRLVDGMNISLKVKREIDNSLIVPKSAVLARQGKKIVFVYVDGEAIWKYVTTGFENSTQVSITKGLKAGEEVIYENNLGLAHQTKVILNN
jgi:RND family efflux transporter MFP subunit